MPDGPESEELDACSESFDTEKNTSDDDIDGLILFADVDFTDQEAVDKRKAEWEELFT